VARRSFPSPTLLAEVAVSFAFDGELPGRSWSGSSNILRLLPALLGERNSRWSKTLNGHSDSLPYIAFDGSRYLIIWQGVTNTLRNICGEFIDRSAPSRPSVPNHQRCRNSDLDAMNDCLWHEQVPHRLLRCRTGTNAFMASLSQLGRALRF